MGWGEAEAGVDVVDDFGVIEGVGGAEGEHIEGGCGIGYKSLSWGYGAKPQCPA